MDNNFDNSFSNEPRRPFTEKPEQPQAQNPAFGFNPEKPLMQQPEPQPGQSFTQPPQSPVYPGAFGSEPKPPFTAQGSNDYSHPSYYSSYNANRDQGYENAFRQYNGQPVQPPVQPPMQPPVQPQFQHPAQPAYVTPLQAQAPPRPAQQSAPENPYEYRRPEPAPEQQGYYLQPAEKKPKGNKALIAIIIVLAVLLAASFTGILIYAISNGGSGNNTVDPRGNGNSNSFAVPDFTMPQDQPATEAPVFDQSDYSDKVQKDYKGLELEQKPADAATNKSYGAEYSFQKTSPAVVGIKCFSDNDKTLKSSEGSGMIISEDGYAITNAHVILNSKTASLISVYTADGKEFNAGVVGFDPRTDIALLKLDDAKGLPFVRFGDTDKLEQGKDILIVGNPGGMEFQNSMTKGIVSALERDASKKSLAKYIQTDAAINPGNSGGPAVNMYGQVIGMATSKIVNESYEGMGFCIPSATIKTITDSLMKNGYVENRVKIGITGTALTSAEAAQIGVPGGIEVYEVDPEGPCGKSGIQEGDILYEADGQTITSFADIYNVLEKHKDGDKIKIKYYHYEQGSNGFSGEYTQKEAEIVLAADKG